MEKDKREETNYEKSLTKDYLGALNFARIVNRTKSYKKHKGPTNITPKKKKRKKR